MLNKLNRLLIGGVLFLLAFKVYAQLTFATASVGNQGGDLRAIINQHITINGNHFAFIYNNSSIQNQYFYTFRLCVPGNGCSTRTYSIGLTPHQSINIFGQSVLNAIFYSPGLYTVTATTIVNGNSQTITGSGTNIADIIEP